MTHAQWFMLGFYAGMVCEFIICAILYIVLKIRQR